MSRLATLRRAIVDDLSAAIPDARSVEPYGGRLNLDEVTRLTTRTPALRVAVVSAPSSRPAPGGPFRMEPLIAVFVVAEDRLGTDRDEVALALAEAVVGRAAAWTWRGVAEASMPSDLKLESLYSGSLDKRGIALLAVTWTQAVPIGVDRIAADRAGLPPFADPTGLGVAGAAHTATDPGAG